MHEETSPPEQGELREMNESMADRILRGAEQPLFEGNYALRVLEIAGRGSGRPRRTPLGVVQRSHRYFVVSPDRTRDWVRNLAEHRACRLMTSTTHTSCTAEPVTGPDGAEVIATYLHAMRAPWAWRAFAVPEEASAEQVRPRMDVLAVFHLEPDAKESPR